MKRRTSSVCFSVIVLWLCSFSSGLLQGAPVQQSVLYIRVNASDDLEYPLSDSDATVMKTRISQYYGRESYGKLSLNVTMTPVVTLPKTLAWYQADAQPTQSPLSLVSDGRVAAKALGQSLGLDYDSYNFTHVIVHAKDILVNSVSTGQGIFVGGIYGSPLSLIPIHELGHRMGFSHASSHFAWDYSVIGLGITREYGDLLDPMGCAWGCGDHFSGGLPPAFKAESKVNEGWMDAARIQSVAVSGRYTVFAQDIAALDSTRFYGLSISGSTYTIEMRQSFDNLSMGEHFRNAVLLRRNGLLLVPNYFGLEMGETLSDPAAQLHITPVAAGQINSEYYVEVQINRGTFPGNLAPSITISATQVNLSAGQSVIFTAQASDPNSDQLAYAWDFDEAVGEPGYVAGANAASVSKSWNPSTPRQYRVRCTVSDMKGGRASDSLVVTVDAPSSATRRLNGRVLLSNGSPLENALIIGNFVTVQPAAGQVSARTDSDGTFSLLNVPYLATLSVYAIKDGMRIIPSTCQNALFEPVSDMSFTPITCQMTVNADINGFEMVAYTKQELQSTVSLAVADSTLNEGGAETETVLTVSRSASAAGQAIPVTVNLIHGAAASGPPATPGEDYSVLDGGQTIPNQSFTITFAANQLSKQLTIRTKSDHWSEVTEGLRVRINAGDYVTGVNQVNLTIADDGDSTSATFDSGSFDVAGAFRVVFHGGAQPPILEVSDDLSEWKGSSASLVTSSGSSTFTDSSVAGLRARFYRLRSAVGVSSSYYGFVKKQLPPGYTMVANPLRRVVGAGVNRTADVLQYLNPANTVLDLFIFSSATQAPEWQSWFNGTSWSDPDYPLPPGTGFLLYNHNPGAAEVTFVGEVPQGTLTHAVSAGLNCYGALVPQKGRIKKILGLNLPHGGQVLKFDGTSYQTFTHLFVGGNSVWSPSEPVLDLAESVYIQVQTPLNWTSSYTLWRDPGVLVKAGSPTTIIVSGSSPGITGLIEASQDLTNWTILTPLVGTAAPLTRTDSSGLVYRHYRARFGQNLSTNYAGYVRRSTPAGYSLFANPFRHLEDGSLGGTLTNVLEETKMYIWHEEQFYLAPLTYEINVQCYPGFYKWTFADCSTPPPFQLNASVFLFSPASQFVATAGDVPTGDLQIPLLGNLDRTYIGTILPVALPLGWSGAANTLQFPAADGDRVYLFDPATQNYKDVYTYFDGYGWNSANADDPGPLGPILQPGVGMIVEKAGPAVTWTFAYKKWQ